MNRIQCNIENNIYNNCILTMVAHSIMARKYPELNYEFSWDDVTFNINDSQGCRGSISFCKNSIVGFFQNMSLINNESVPALILEKVTFGFPNDIINIANHEALRYLLYDDNDSKIATPLVTTGFYVSDENNVIYINEEYDDFIKNGAYCIENQLKSFRETYNYLLDNYEMDEMESELLLQIYKLRINSEEKIYLNAEIIKALSENFNEFIEFTIESFNEINIYF